MHSVYILESESTKKFYIGCAAQVLVRLAEHQRGQTQCAAEDLAAKSRVSFQVYVLSTR
jgi:predicted GIY-YIG superfamily endonuclease